MHQWMVKRGRIGLSANDNVLLMEMDSEGTDSCLLTAQDTNEVSELMTQYAQKLWDKASNKEEYHQLYKETSDGNFVWKNTSGEITVGLNSEKDSVEIKYVGVSPCEVSVNQAVEMIQMLQKYVSG